MKIYSFHAHAFTIFSSVLSWPSNNNTVQALLRGGVSKSFQENQEYSHRARKLVSMESCDLSFKMECSSTLGGSCDSIPPQNTECYERPSEMMMRFQGGSCDQSDNVQKEAGKFECTDHADGGLFTEHGTKYYLRISALDGSGDYFAGFAQVGDDITLEDGGNRFENEVIVKIYNATDTSSTTTRDPDDILAGTYDPVQEIHFEASCSQNLFLSDIFGSIKVIGFVNDNQGSVSVFHKVSIRYTVAAESDKPIFTRFGPMLGFWTQTEDSEVITTKLNDDSIARETIHEDNLSVSGEMLIEIDLSTEKLYVVTGTIDGIRGSSTGPKQCCTGSDTVTFTTGEPQVVDGIMPRGETGGTKIIYLDGSN